MYELRRRLGFTLESLAHVGVTREMRVHHLDDYRAIERDVQSVVDVRHTAFADAMHDAVPATGNVAKRRDRGVGRLRALAGHHRQQLAAAEATRRRRPVP